MFRGPWRKCISKSTTSTTDVPYPWISRVNKWFLLTRKNPSPEPSYATRVEHIEQRSSNTLTFNKPWCNLWIETSCTFFYEVIIAFIFVSHLVHSISSSTSIILLRDSSSECRSFIRNSRAVIFSKAFASDLHAKNERDTHEGYVVGCISSLTLSLYSLPAPSSPL